MPRSTTDPMLRALEVGIHGVVHARPALTTPSRAALLPAPPLPPTSS